MSKTTAIAKKEDAFLCEGDWQIDITIDDLKKKYAPKASDTEFALYVDQVKANKLDPRKRECYFVKYGSNPGQTIVGYQTYIKRAMDTGKLAGWSCDISQDGQQSTVTIHRKDWEHPFIWSVEREEFDTGKALWATKGKFMLKKVCIGQAFRLAFPEELGGMPYLQEELGELVGDRVIEADKTPSEAAEEPKSKKKAPAKAKTKKKSESSLKPVAEPSAPVAEEATEPVEDAVVVEEPAEPTPSTEVEEASTKVEVAGKLTEDVVENILAAYEPHDVDEASINTMLGTTSRDEWNELHKKWLLDIWMKVDDNDEEAVSSLKSGSFKYSD